MTAFIPTIRLRDPNGPSSTTRSKSVQRSSGPRSINCDSETMPQRPEFPVSGGRTAKAVSAGTGRASRLRLAQRTRITTSVAIAIGLALAMPSCAPVTVPLPAPSPTATVPGTPIREPIGLPEDAKDAIEAASDAVQADQVALLNIVEGTIAPDSMSAYAARNRLEEANAFLDVVLEDQTVIGTIGEPDIWVADLTGSSAGPLEVMGRSYRLGSVQLVGCLEYRWELEHSEESSSTATQPSTIGQHAPYRAWVEYEPSSRVWLVTDLKDLTGQADAISCPLE